MSTAGALALTLFLAPAVILLVFVIDAKLDEILNRRRIK